MTGSWLGWALGSRDWKVLGACDLGDDHPAHRRIAWWPCPVGYNSAGSTKFFAGRLPGRLFRDSRIHCEPWLLHVIS